MLSTPNQTEMAVISSCHFGSPSPTNLLHSVGYFLEFLWGRSPLGFATLRMADSFFSATTLLAFP